MLLIASSVSVLGIVALVYITTGGSSDMPDPAAQSREQIIETLGSEEFRSLQTQQRRDYARKAFRQVMHKTVDEYFELPDEKKTAYLDKVIDQRHRRREQRRQRFSRQNDNARSEDRPERQAAGDDQKPQNRRPRRRERSAGSIRGFSERMDSATRAKFVQFRKDMRARMQQRGMDTPRR
jgi:hypothetical protein